MAEELAQDDGVELPAFYDCMVSWECSYYCKINGMRYKVTQKKKAMYGKIYHKIELI
jgi:predicted enzyme related to lactoylglutathione lyase